jgi:Berberine and berberine like
VIVFNSSELTSTIQTFTAGYEALAKKGLPAGLGIQQNIFNTLMGRCFAVGFLWSSPDLDTGRQYLDQIASFGQVVHNSVTETTIPVWMDDITKFAPKESYGSTCTINLRKLTEEVNIVIGQEIAKMPDDPSTLLVIHQLRGPSEAANADSVFGARAAHYCLEFVATSSDQERTKVAWDWAVGFRDAIRKTNAQNILTATYISLTPPTEASSPAIYGENWDKLVEIKKQYDPKNVFKHALPKFPEMATENN